MLALYFTVRPGDKLTIIYIMVTLNSRAFSEAVGVFLWENKAPVYHPQSRPEGGFGAI